MEQRIGSSSQPLEGAGFDPAFIPGLTSPAATEKEAEQPTEVDAAADLEAEAAGTAEPSPATGTPEAADTEDAENAGNTEKTAEAGDDDEVDEPVDGPVFEASDRRARIVADHRGVRLALDDQACEFRWDEIGAVETESPRFGKRFTITVHTPDRRWFPIEIEASARARFAEWEGQLDAVLDAYFEDGTEVEPVEGAEDTENAEDAEDAEDAENAEGTEEPDADAETDAGAEADADADKAVADAKEGADGDLKAVGESKSRTDNGS
ncbi:hypothetical protein ACIO13_16980 [Streptomyces sp. NPDC087425]|uniref:hypothetical protein n=1 Tax=Streptomyces sp. NPDC087425 TaxID=3365787 RepID=UPI00380A5099